MHRIFSICFHFNRLENDKNDSSSEAHLQSLKTSRGIYLDPESYRTFLLKYLNSISWPCPFKYKNGDLPAADPSADDVDVQSLLYAVLKHTVASNYGISVFFSRREK
jgi:hypothetical protein